MKNLLRLLKLIKPLFSVMVLAVIFGTTGFFCAIGIPVLGIIAFYERFPLKILVLLGIFRGVFHYAEQYCNHYIAFSLLARIRNIVFAKLRELGPAKLEGRQKGNLISLITSDIELLELFFAHTVSPVCIAFFVCAGVTAFLWISCHCFIALTALFFYSIMGIFVPLLLQRISQKAGCDYREQFAQMNAFLLDNIRGLMQTILYGTGAKKMKILQIKNNEFAKTKEKMALNEGITASIIDSCVILACVSMLFVSVTLYGMSQIDFSCVIISVAVILSSFGPVIAVARLGSSLSQTIAAAQRVLSLLDEKSVVDVVNNQTDCKVFVGADLEKVSFSYNKTLAFDEQIILSELSLDIPKNKIIGLQGKSGCGKSTVLKLFMRFWEVQSGTVHVSCLPVQKINTDSLRSLESCVTQETVLFHDTIENNIKIAKLDAASWEVQEACKKASIHDFIMSLPNGYQTQIAELGDNFSGGERQRLGLARAFLHDGNFLLLDEPTSNLDSYNEKIILDSVFGERGKKTIVLVSHRESTLKICDKIYKIENRRNS
ncbi:MAG: ABC transporter ATP-binding protein/permease [Treponema sp.]|nr:ABC transporter ATP-binding protein/permease [Treponema sp.]